MTRFMAKRPVVRSSDAIAEVFAKTRETIAHIESKFVEAVCPEWSVAQHVRRVQ